LRPAELAAHAQVTEAEVGEWLRLGLLEPEEELGAGALERARLLKLATSRGLTAEAIAEASRREGDILQRFVDFVRPAPGQVKSLDEAAERAGLDTGFIRRLAVAAGLSEEDLGPDDLEAMAAVRAAPKSSAAASPIVGCSTRQLPRSSSPAASALSSTMRRRSSPPRSPWDIRVSPSCAADR
jgi:hypothetical protein